MIVLWVVLWLTLTQWLFIHPEPPIPPTKSEIITEVRGYTTVGHSEPKIEFKEVL